MDPIVKGFSLAILYHPRAHVRVRHEARIKFSENPVTVARDEIIDGVAEGSWNEEERARPTPPRQMREHRQRAVGFEIRGAAMDHGVGVGIIGINPEGLREPCAVRRLDRREAKPRRYIPRGDEAHPARPEDADAV